MFDVEAAKAALPRILSKAVRAEHVSNGVVWNCLEYRREPSQEYPLMHLGGRQTRVSRVVLTAALGRPLSEQALHRCDNTVCVDVEHLYEGTESRNMLDAVERGRWNPRQRLIGPVFVTRIVGSVMPARELANLLGVSERTVRGYRRAARRSNG